MWNPIFVLCRLRTTKKRSFFVIKKEKKWKVKDDEQCEYFWLFLAARFQNWFRRENSNFIWWQSFGEFSSNLFFEFFFLFTIQINLLIDGVGAVLLIISALPDLCRHFFLLFSLGRTSRRKKKKKIAKKEDSGIFHKVSVAYPKQGNQK